MSGIVNKMEQQGVIAAENAVNRGMGINNPSGNTTLPAASGGGGGLGGVVSQVEHGLGIGGGNSGGQLPGQAPSGGGIVDKLSGEVNKLTGGNVIR